MSQGQQTQRRPTLLSSCARATTAAEARYRISAPEFSHRSSRVIALDRWSAAIVGDAAAQSWGGGHFLVFESALPDDALLRRARGKGEDCSAATALLSEELDGADTVVMVASARGIMSAGLVVPSQAEEATSSRGIVSALRPNAMVLVILRTATDLPEVLSALRV